MRYKPLQAREQYNYTANNRTAYRTFKRLLEMKCTAKVTVDIIVKRIFLKRFIRG